MSSTIKFEVSVGGVCVTPCPFGNEPRVGSIGCSSCRHNDAKDNDLKIVECSYIAGDVFERKEGSDPLPAMLHTMIKEAAVSAVIDSINKMVTSTSMISKEEQSKLKIEIYETLITTCQESIVKAENGLKDTIFYELHLVYEKDTTPVVQRYSTLSAVFAALKAGVTVVEKGDLLHSYITDQNGEEVYPNG